MNSQRTPYSLYHRALRKELVEILSAAATDARLVLDWETDSPLNCRLTVERVPFLGWGGVWSDTT